MSSIISIIFIIIYFYILFSLISLYKKYFALKFLNILTAKIYCTTPLIKRKVKIIHK